MEEYKLAFKKSISKDLRTISKKDVARILRWFDALAKDPRPQGSEKLSGQARYRVRQGVYRIVYEIRDDVRIIVVVKVAHRREGIHRLRRKP
jgi:mRNA interferase RelE/StbE